MNDFQFYNPTKILLGRDSIEKIGAEIKKHNIKNILLLYGKGSVFKNGAYERVNLSLEKNGISRIEAGGVKPNPTLDKVIEAAELCKKNKIEGILALGGGSVIDSAKAIGAAFYYQGNIWDAFEKKVKLTKSLPIFSVLTLSAAGSEMNPFAVITNEFEKKKWDFSAGAASYPRISAIDPSIQATLPREQTVNGAIDAMSHVFELYFDSATETDIQDEIAEGIIRTVMKHAAILLEDNENYQSRAQLAWCCVLALNGINQAGRLFGDWASHSIEHTLSAYYDIAHGAGLAIIFPAWMKYVYKYNLTKFVRFSENIFNVKTGSNLEKAEKAIENLILFYKSLGAPTSLREIGVKKSEIEELAKNAALRGTLGDIKKLEFEDIKNIFNLAY